jgi:hypothetical protein
MYDTASHNPILPPSEKPDWLEYPVELLELVRSNRMPLIPWHFDRAESAAKTYRRFRSHLGRYLVPFAFRQDQEDWACFEKGKGQQVLIIHDNTSPGWEDEGHYSTFSEWLRDVEEEAAFWAESAQRLSGEAE